MFTGTAINAAMTVSRIACWVPGSARLRKKTAMPCDSADEKISASGAISTSNVSTKTMPSTMRRVTGLAPTGVTIHAPWD